MILAALLCMAPLEAQQVGIDPHWSASAVGGAGLVVGGAATGGDVTLEAGVRQFWTVRFTSSAHVAMTADRAGVYVPYVVAVPTLDVSWPIHARRTPLGFGPVVRVSSVLLWFEEDGWTATTLGGGGFEVVAGRYSAGEAQTRVTVAVEVGCGGEECGGWPQVTVHRRRSSGLLWELEVGLREFSLAVGWQLSGERDGLPTL